MYKKPYLRRTYRTYQSRSNADAFKRRRVAAIAPLRSYVPRTVFSPMPAQFNICMSLTQQQNYEATAQAVNSFGINTVLIQGVDGVYPPYFEELMRIYSRAIVKKTYVSVQFHSLDQPNESLNIAMGVITNRENNDLLLNQATMDKLRSMPQAQTKFLGASNGGHDIASFSTFIDQSSWSRSIPEENLTTISRYNTLGNIIITAPDDRDPTPTVVFMYTPTQALPINFQVIRKVTYHITFSGRHLG